jgi:hypothetical protein
VAYAGEEHLPKPALGATTAVIEGSAMPSPTTHDAHPAAKCLGAVQGRWSIARLAAAFVLTLPLVGMTGGCNIIGGAAAMMESAKRATPVTVEAEYVGLTGKSFAVMVTADQVIQAEYPEIVSKVAMDATKRLTENSNATGVVPAELVLQFQFQNPRWAMRSPSEILKQLGCDRLIIIDVRDYRLTDPGNKWLWKGRAVGAVSVFEADSALPDDAVFRKTVDVAFPDVEGQGPAEIPRVGVNSVLVKRFIDRATWLFYTHEEKYDPDY